MKIYYAHVMYIYETDDEKAKILQIKKNFPPGPSNVAAKLLMKFFVKVRVLVD